MGKHIITLAEADTMTLLRAMRGAIDKRLEPRGSAVRAAIARGSVVIPTQVDGRDWGVICGAICDELIRRGAGGLLC